MNLRLKKFNFTVAGIIVLLVIMDINMFYLIDIPQPLTHLWGTYNKSLLVIISIALFAWTRGFWNSDLFIKKYTIALCMSVAIVAIISSQVYAGNRIYNVLIECSQYFLVFLAFPLLKLVRKENGYDRILYAINVITLVLYILYILQSIAYEKNGTLFLHVNENLRNNALRMSLKSFGNVMIIYNFCRLWFDSNYKHKIFSLIQFILGIYCLLFIQQTRAYYFVIAISLIVVLLFCGSSSSKKIRNIAIIILFSVMLFSSGLFDQFLGSFGENSDMYGNTLVRMNAIGYFWEEFVHSPLWGHGIITTAQYFTIRTGPLGSYFYADVGIIGLMAQFGIFSFVIYVWPMLRWGRHILRHLRSGKLDPFLIAMYIYMLASTPSLLCVNQALCIIWPFSLAFFAYSNEKLGEEEDKNGYNRYNGITCV